MMTLTKKLSLTFFCLLLGGCVAAVGLGAAAGTTATVANDRRTTGTVVEDQAIEFKASKAFFEDKEIIDSSHINVTSYNTVVLVTGETPDEVLRQRIIGIVSNLPKVSHVYDELTIAAPSSLVSRTSDSVITSKVKAKLFVKKKFDATRIKVVTEKGIVYLMGLLRQRRSRRGHINCAKNQWRTESR